MVTYTYSIDDTLKITRCSQVESPATEFNTEFFSKQVFFSSDDTNIIGVAILADTPIPRLNESTGEIYNVVFTKPVCDYFLSQILSNGLPLSLDHSQGPCLDAVLKGAFQVSPLLPFQSAPNGSVVLHYQASPEVISELKKRSGFSIEIFYSSLIPLPESSDSVSDCFSLLLNSLTN